MYVDVEDISDEAQSFPVRQGCSGGPCACTGSCTTIVGHISREKYVDFMAKFVSVETFLSENMIPFFEESNSSEKILQHIYWESPGSKYIVVEDLKKELYKINNQPYTLAFLVDLITSLGSKKGDKYFDIILENIDIFDSVFNKHGIKIEKNYV